MAVDITTSHYIQVKKLVPTYSFCILHLPNRVITGIYFKMKCELKIVELNA
jgi:hypothetical protein